MPHARDNENAEVIKSKHTIDSIILLHLGFCVCLCVLCVPCSLSGAHTLRRISFTASSRFCHWRCRFSANDSYNLAWMNDLGTSINLSTLGTSSECNSNKRFVDRILTLAGAFSLSFFLSLWIHRLPLALTPANTISGLLCVWMCVNWYATRTRSSERNLI